MFWPEGMVWQVIEGAPFAALLASPTGMLVHDTLSARIDPARAIESLSVALTRLGVPIDTDGPEQGAVIHATGHAGLAALSRDMGVALGGAEKGQAARLDANLGAAPQLFIAGVHIVPQADGTTAIGSTSERAFTDTLPDANLEDLITRARSLCPALAEASVLHRWAGLRPRSVTRAPILGPWPERPGHFIANGGFKIGFGMAPIIAELMCEMVLEGRDAIPEAFHVATAMTAAANKS